MGFWKTFGKIATIGGAALATGLTGGAASPLLAAAIGAGSGAALAAENGKRGWDIVKGGALGAGTGALAGGLGSAIKGGSAAATAAKSAGSTASTASKVAGAVLGNGTTTGSLASRIANAGINTLTGQNSIGKALQVGGNTAGALAQGMAAGRENKLKDSGTQDKLQNDRYNMALRAALAQNIKDVQITGLPEGVHMATITGGARPSAIGPEGLAAARLQYGTAMDKLQHLPTIDPGKAENVLGVVGTIGKGITDYKNQTDANSIVQRLLAAAKDPSAAPAGPAAPVTTPPFVGPRMPPPYDPTLAEDYYPAEGEY